jgi:hypothetical protein
MSDVVPPAAVLAAGNATAFVLADAEVAEFLAVLAPYTTPARFQMILLSLASDPEELEWRKHKHACLRATFLDSLVGVARLNP